MGIDTLRRDITQTYELADMTTPKFDTLDEGVAEGRHAECEHGTLVSPLRWAGSKRHHLPFLRELWSPTFRRYVEPFAGSATLFFALQPSKALLADLNEDLVEMFNALRRYPRAIYEALTSFPRGRRAYYRVRAIRKDCLTEAGRAARVLYLNRFCFNGLYRTNLQGLFNVPYGAPKNSNLPELHHLLSCSALLANAEVVHADFRKTLMQVKGGDFVYLDPPYALSGRRVFVEYGKRPFTVGDLADLGQLLFQIHLRKAHFVLSYADCKEARRMLGTWPTRRFFTRRNVAGFANARRKQCEVFISNLPGFQRSAI